MRMRIKEVRGHGGGPNSGIDSKLAPLNGAFHRFIVSLTPAGVHFNELHCISFHFTESAVK